MRKQSKRVAVTKSTIETAYLEVLAERPGNKITVKEVCTRAAVNRTTFYKYYEDADGLGSIVRKNMLSYIEELLKETVPEGQADIYEFISQIILNIYRDVRVRKLPILYREVEFRRDTDALLKKYYYAPKYGSRIPEDDWIRITFITCGLLGLVESWIKDGMTISPEKISNSAIAYAKAMGSDR